ncbi:MAG TPA: carbamoyltransferase [Limnobacter sp.]|nr:carbamoyltransferase [Limnobacter sp.]
MDSYTLGISYGYHDSAAVLLKAGRPVAAAQEERFTRIKQDSAFPLSAIRYCLAEGGIRMQEVECVAYYEQPFKKLRRILYTALRSGLRGLGLMRRELPGWLWNAFTVKHTIASQLREHFGHCPGIVFGEHHRSHAASAFFASPHAKAAVLCIDGVGEWATTSAWQGQENTLKPLWEIRFPHSLGLLYSAVTYYCGFKVDSGEYKVMGLAPYGKPVYSKTMFEHLIDVKADGQFRLNMDYFDYELGQCMINARFEALFGGPRRQPESPLSQRDFDMAASIQQVIEHVILRLATTLQQQTREKNLCLSGGVALNCVANGRLLQNRLFDHIWIQPAAGDAGGALGAALHVHHEVNKQPRTHRQQDNMQSALLGPAYSNAEIEISLKGANAVYHPLDDDALLAEVAKLLAQGKVIGWHQGRMEFGPRALGSRSILGDARNSNLQSVMNLKIKNRESFRPFAPLVLAEHASEWFELQQDSPYMLLVVPVHAQRRKQVTEDQSALQGLELLKVNRSQIPAVTHVDYSARVQTVQPDHPNKRLRRLLEHFHSITGCPVLVNTSFNVRGEPIVENPTQAYTCFMRTQMDHLVVGNFLMHKSEQPDWNEKTDWRTEFALD